VLITFDDGHLDNYLHAYPVLRDLRLPATIFLVTDLVGSREGFWWDRVMAAMRQQGHQDEEIHRRIEELKYLPDRERREEVQRLDPPDPPLPRSLITWDEAREMAAHGIHFGGHTRTHPILSRLDAPAIREEVEGCREVIARETGTSPVAFAYPVGRDFAVSEAAVEEVRRAGFGFAVTTEYGRNRMTGFDPWRLRRIGISLADSLARFKAKFLFPAFFRPPGGSTE
jgi:peptidoglycan/xylan/chitin deacetylase (PgdA/CDA1 family)